MIRFLLGLIIGALLGLIVGCLLAPKSGAECRRAVGKRGRAAREVCPASYVPTAALGIAGMILDRFRQAREGAQEVVQSENDRLSGEWQRASHRG